MSAKGRRPLVPRLRFPEFREAGEWEVQKIHQNLSESRVKGSKGDVAKKLTVKLWGNGVFEKQEALKGSANTQYYRRKAGQFIYSKLDFLNQAFGIVPDRLDNYESTVDLPCFDVSDELNVCFFLEYVQRKDFYKKYGEIADGGRKAKRIQVETFLDFPIFLPRMREQQKIAACLTALDDLISAATGRFDALKQHKQGLMQQLFPAQGETVPRLRFAEFRDAGEWVEKTVEKLCQVNSKVDKLPNEFVYVDLESVANGVLLKKNIIKKESAPSRAQRLLQDKDVIYQMVRPYQKNNYYFIRNDSYNYVASTGYAQLRAIDSSKFLFQLIHIDRFVSSVLEKCIGSNYPAINPSALKQIEVQVPSKKEEQQKIAACLTALDDLISAQTQKIAKLKTHKRGLMQQLFPAIDETHR